MEEDHRCPFCLCDNSKEGRTNVSYVELSETRAYSAGAESAQRSHRTKEVGKRSKHYIGIYNSCAGDQRVCSVTRRWTRGQEDRWLGGGSSYSSGVRLSRGKWNTLSLLFVLLLALVAFEPCLCQIVSVSAPQVLYEIDEGSTSSLECNYTIAYERAQDVGPLEPVLIIAWLKNGVEIKRHQGPVRLTPSEVTERVSIVRPATLLISKTTSFDAGKYSCRVSYNAAVASRNMTLSVIGDRPIIEGLENRDSATFEGGATLRLTCKGFYPLMWSYPYNIDYERVSIRSTLVQIEASSDWEETNNIMITNATYTDSGLFSCTHVHDGDLTGDGGTLSTEIYVYVTDLAAAKNLFLPSDVTNMSIYYGDDLVLPCRLTVPDANVTLIRADQTEVPRNELPPYDNRRGFLLNSSSASKFFGLVSCQASYRGLSATRSFYIEVIKTPTLDVTNKTMQEGTRLSLTCTGGRPLIWKHSSSLSRNAVIEVSTSRAGDDSLFYTSTLTITSASYTDTGRFSCLFLQYLPLHDPTLEESLYIFVIGEDPAHKFLPIDQSSAYIEYDATSTFIVPCRISDPHLQVDAKISYKDSPNIYEEFKSLWNLTYNPEIGYTVVPVNTREDSVFSLTFQCTLDDIPNVLPLSFILQRKGEEFIPLILEVTKSAGQYIAGREELRLSCVGVVQYSLFTLQNSQDFLPSFAWTSPGQTLAGKPTGVAQQGIERLPFFFTYTYKLRRTANLTDNGTFTCHAESRAVSLKKEISVHILERGYARIQRLKEPGEMEEIVKVAGQTFCVLFQVSAYPQPENGWQKVRGSRYTSDGRITLEQANAQDESELNLTMCFRDVDSADEGTYSVITWNSYERSNVTFFLQVNVAPQVSVSIDPSPAELFSEQFFLMRETYTLTCNATGKPTPRSEWRYSNCYDGTTSTCDPEVDSSWATVLDSSAAESIEREGPVTRLRVLLPNSKMYRCLAMAPVPGLEDAHQDVDFRVLDKPNGINVTVDPEKVFRTDNVTLTCSATRFLFDSISWFFVPHGENASTQLPSSEEHSMDDTSPAYSLSSTLTIQNVSDADRGQYTCQAASDEDVRQTTESVTVNVAEVEAASIIAGSKLFIEVDVDTPLRIMCSARGKPIPELAFYRLEDGARKEQMARVEQHDGGEVVTLTYQPEQTMLTMSGLYECVAKNRGGAESRNFSVSVHEGPDVSINIQPSSNVNEGDNVTITCHATRGTPTPTVWIQKDGSATQRGGQPFNFSIDFPNVKADDAGTYRCFASNAVRNVSVTEVLSVKVGTAKLSQVVQIGVVIAVCLAILLIIVIIVVKCHCKRPKVRRASRLSSLQLRTRSMRFMSIYSTSGEDPYENLPYDPRWEFPRERLTLGSVIGKGAFGMVIKAVAVGIDGTEKNIIVAVKQVRAGASSAEKKALWAELKMLGHIGRHLNVVNFLGACTKDGPVLAIVEYCSRGNMLDFLRSKRKYFKDSPEVTGSGSQTGHSSSTGASSFQSSTGSERRMKAVYSSVIVEEANLQDDPIDVEDLLCYSFQVARGMEFLASKNVIHRDLAARNVLITENYVVKICDFGLARHLYDDPDYVASGKQGRLPIKWMAPESIFDKVFTIYSDVWAYAVFLWEVFSLGGSPYPGFQMDESFYSKIKNGYRMNAPEYAPPGIYDTMLECWTPEPEARPSFSVLAVRLGDMLEANVRSEYIELNVPYEESNKKASNELPSPHEDTPLLRKPFQTDVETSHLNTPTCCVTVPTIEEAEEVEERSTLSDDRELDVSVRSNGRTGSETAAEA